MTGRTWFVRQVRGRRRWTTRTSPPGANVAWTLLAEDERVMTAGDAIVYIVDDDAPLRRHAARRLDQRAHPVRIVGKVHQHAQPAEVVQMPAPRILARCAEEVLQPLSY